MGESFEELQRHLVVAGRSLMLLDKRVLDQDAEIIALKDALNDTLNMLRAAHMQLGMHHDSNKRVIKARAFARGLAR